MSARKNPKVQPVQVFLRTMPLVNTDESILKSLGDKQIEIRQRGGRHYTFDGVFGPQATQNDIYSAVVKPLIAEVLSGFNCTVFVYGQTGTGKTYTMAGGSVPDENTSWEDMENAGLIPRALADLFDELLIQTDYTVRVWYLELYNEDLYDLLSDSTNDHIRLKIYEDKLKKGSVTVHGIREMTVTNKNEVFNFLKKGQEKRRTASTLLNATSSRSHAVFCITVHTRETNEDGEVLVKTGKLYLVDLAGSENITRAGSASERAREAGSINQSLLTLGRVMKSLVERSSHIPYRESKLTRILQDSLGGHTKTSIIATISLETANTQETISTLEYAHRARNITNRPEVNQSITQKAYLKHYETQLERLRKDLEAARSCTGIVIDQENYYRLLAENSSNRRIIAEETARNRLLEEELQITREDLAKSDARVVEAVDFFKLFYPKMRELQPKMMELYPNMMELLPLCSQGNQTVHQFADHINQIIDNNNEDEVNVSKILNQAVRETNEFTRSIQETNEDLDSSVDSNSNKCGKTLIDQTKERIEMIKTQAFSAIHSIMATANEKISTLEEIKESANSSTES